MGKCACGNKVKSGGNRCNKFGHRTKPHSDRYFRKMRAKNKRKKQNRIERGQVMAGTGVKAGKAKKKT